MLQSMGSQRVRHDFATEQQEGGKENRVAESISLHVGTSVMDEKGLSNWATTTENEKLHQIINL